MLLYYPGQGLHQSLHLGLVHGGVLFTVPLCFGYLQRPLIIPHQEPTCTELAGGASIELHQPTIGEYAQVGFPFRHCARHAQSKVLVLKHWDLT